MGILGFYFLYSIVMAHSIFCAERLADAYLAEYSVWQRQYEEWCLQCIEAQQEHLQYAHQTLETPEVEPNRRNAGKSAFTFSLHF